MDWQNKAQGEFGGNWLAPGFLDHTDPYLLWLDVSRFVGTALSGTARVLPTIRQMQGPGPRFKTDAVVLAGAGAKDNLLSLADPARRGDTVRFEVAAGFAIDDPNQPSAGVNAGGLAPSTGISNRKADQARPVIGFIDYGCAFANRQFRRLQDDPSSTRVLAIWDQERTDPPPVPPLGVRALQWGMPTDFRYGAETHRDRSWGHAGALPMADYIRQFLRQGQLDEQALYKHCGYPAIQGRSATHGTHVMDLATGWPNPLRGLPSAGAISLEAPHDADIVFVQLPRTVKHRQISGLLRANVYDGIRYILKCAHPKQPVIINLSYGGNVGPHDGSSVLEQAIDWRLTLPRAQSDPGPLTLVVPSGNARQDSEGRDGRLHSAARLNAHQTASFCWNNAPDDPSESFVELWLPLRGDFQVRVTPPAGHAASDALTPGMAGTWTDAAGKAVASLVFAKQVCQSDRGRMVLLAVARTRLGPGAPVAPYGRWTIDVSVGALAEACEIDAWCERDVPPFGGWGMPHQAYFTPTATSQIKTDSTLNSIAHGAEVIVVGGQILGSGAAGYSGTGPGRSLSGRLRNPDTNKPPRKLRGPEALAASDESAGAPGLLAAAVYGSDKVRLAGTSMAAAVMTRQCFEQNPLARGPMPRRRRLRPHPDDDLAQP